MLNWFWHQAYSNNPIIKCLCHDHDSSLPNDSLPVYDSSPTSSPQAMGVLYANRQLAKDLDSPTSLQPDPPTTLDPAADPAGPRIDPSCCAPPTDPMRKWLLMHGGDTVYAFDRLLAAKDSQIRVCTLAHFETYYKNTDSVGFTAIIWISEF